MRTSYLVLSLCLVAGLGVARAQDDSAAPSIELKGRRVNINSADATLVRTSETRRKTKLFFNVPMKETVCAQYQTDIITERHPRCGQRQIRRTRIERQCVSRVCSKRDANKKCIRYTCRKFKNVEVVYYDRINRVCSREVTNCVRSEVRTYNISRKVTLKFRKSAGQLSEGQTERYNVSVSQRRVDGNKLNVAVKSVDADREIKIKRFFGTKIIVK